MAKTISDEQMKFTIIVNGNEAQKELFGLEKSTRSLTEENKSLLLQKKLLEKQGKKDTDQYKELTGAIKANNTEIAKNKDRMSELQKEIGLTGMTMAQLQSKATMLRNTLRNLVPGSEDYKKYSEELNQVNGRLSELRGNSQTAQNSLGSLADRFNRYQGMALAVIGVLTGMVLSVQKIIDINGKLSDTQSDVMKTTGMTKKEVDELTKSFGLLQTRTSRIDLLGIAEQGGRIGIAKAEIGDFVNVMNKASVALGDSFTGGAEEVSEKLGKIKFLFEETKDLDVDQAYNSIGSAINDLGANGVASEANISNFTTRIGSLTDVLKPTIQETLALGTAFEESGIEAEVSARAYGIFMSQASKESGKFAQVMGISQKAVENMINTDPLEFMLKFSEGMKGMDATETAKTLDYLGISADGANKVIGAMGNNTKRFRELIDLSNNSFATGTSLVNEYDVKNNNLASTLEKISKTVSGWFSSETFVKWLTVGVDWLAKFIGATEDADGSTAAWKNTLVFLAKVIAIITAAMVTNTAWQQLVVLWTNRNTEASILYSIASKARAVADGIAMVASQAYAAATMLMTGNLNGAAQAFRVMTATMMTTPWGFIIGAIAAVGAAYVLFSEQVDTAAAIQKNFADIHLEATKNIASQKSELDLLTKIALDEAVAEDKRLKAIQRLNEIIPDHVGLLSLQNIKTAEGTAILKKYTDELYANARAKAVQSKFDELADQRLDIEGKSSKDYQSSTGRFLSKITGQGEGPEFKSRKDIEQYVLKMFGPIIGLRKDKTTGTDLVNKEKFDQLVNKYVQDYHIDDKEKELALKDAEMKALEGELVKNKVNDLGKPDDSTSPKSNYNVMEKGSGSGEKKDPNSTAEEIARLRLENDRKYADLLLKQQRQLEDDRIAAMQDGYEKEMAIEALRYKRELEDLDRQKVHADDLAKIDEDIAKAKESKDMTRYNALLSIRKGWDKKNQDLDDQINKIKEGKLAIHNLKVATIQEKAAKEAFDKEKQQYETEKLQRETAFNEQLLALGNDEVAKAKLKKKYEQEELEAQEKFLERLVKEQQDILAGLNKNVDVNLLSPEQRKSIEDEITKLKNQISDLLLQINKLKGGGAGTDFSILQGTGTDILGFSPEQWTQVFSNLDTAQEKIKATETVLGGLQNVWSMYAGFVEGNQQRELQALDKKQTAERNKLKKQLDYKQVSQAHYDRQMKRLDDEKERAQAEADYNRAKNERIGALLSIASSTGIGIMKAVAAAPLTGGMPWAAIIGGMGLLNAAMVLKKPLPAKGHEEGLYPEHVKRTQDGKIFRSRFMGKTRSGLVSDTSHFLVAENGPEMVIDNKAWRQMDPAVKEALVRDLRGIKGFEQGIYSPEVRNPSNTPIDPSTPSGDAALMQMVLAVVAENTAVMKQLKESGVLAIVSNKDYKSMKNLKDGIDDYTALRNKSKK